LPGVDSDAPDIRQQHQRFSLHAINASRSC
jgi:hypothetical protein